MALQTGQKRQSTERPVVVNLSVEDAAKIQKYADALTRFHGDYCHCTHGPFNDLSEVLHLYLVSSGAKLKWLGEHHSNENYEGFPYGDDPDYEW